MDVQFYFQSSLVLFLTPRRKIYDDNLSYSIKIFNVSDIIATLLTDLK